MSINVLDKSSKSRLTLFRLVPFAALGVLVFSFNANQEMPYMVKGYLTLLEVQVGFLAVFLATRKLIRSDKK
jgi:hypothetical protein